MVDMKLMVTYLYYNSISVYRAVYVQDFKGATTMPTVDTIRHNGETVKPLKPKPGQLPSWAFYLTRMKSGSMRPEAHALSALIRH